MSATEEWTEPREEWLKRLRQQVFDGWNERDRTWRATCTAEIRLNEARKAYLDAVSRQKAAQDALDAVMPPPANTTDQP